MTNDERIKMITTAGTTVRHFKREMDSEGDNYLYQVVGVATHTETGEKLVVYKALYGEGEVFARPYEEFIGPVDKKKYPDIKQEYRFESYIADCHFNIYTEKYVSLKGDIRGGCLSLESMVYGEDYDSEQHIDFSKAETDKLFALISLDEFIALGKKEHLRGLDEFMDAHGIKRDTYTF